MTNHDTQVSPAPTPEGIPAGPGVTPDDQLLVFRALMGGARTPEAVAGRIGMPHRRARSLIWRLVSQGAASMLYSGGTHRFDPEVSEAEFVARRQQPDASRRPGNSGLPIMLTKIAT